MTTSWYNRSTRVWTTVDYKLKSWTTANRPAGGSLVVGVSGINTDFNGQETYTSEGWMVTNGKWTTATRPTGVVAGSRGFNTDTNQGETLDDNGEWVNE